jgi:hypothetical protein
MDIRVLIPIVVMIGIFVAAMAAFLFRRSRSGRLQQRFGPEYDRTAAQQQDDVPRPEAPLADHENRAEAFPLRTLSPIARDAYAMEWATVQRRFIEDPSAAVGTADRLFSRVMIDRGYPMIDFDQRAAELSVSHPTVVQNYRAGHGIVMRHADGQATTEELRQAMIHYRTLFDELLQPAVESAPSNIRPINQRRGGITHERAS